MKGAHHGGGRCGLLAACLVAAWATTLSYAQGSTTHSTCDDQLMLDAFLAGRRIPSVNTTQPLGPARCSGLLQNAAPAYLCTSRFGSTSSAAAVLVSWQGGAAPVTVYRGCGCKRSAQCTPNTTATNTTNATTSTSQAPQHTAATGDEPSGDSGTYIVVGAGVALVVVCVFAFCAHVLRNRRHRSNIDERANVLRALTKRYAPCYPVQTQCGDKLYTEGIHHATLYKHSVAISCTPKRRRGAPLCRWFMMCHTTVGS